jgi:hypothetical protein
VRRRFGDFGTASWPGFLWCLALLGLLLLSSDYRAGAEVAHAHSLVQLWADAHDGVIYHQHHQHLGADVAASRDPSLSWFDPAVGEASNAEEAAPDVGKHQDSAPVTSGVHLLLVAVAALVVAAASAAPTFGPAPRLAGRAPRILLPPPRWTPAPL